VALTAAAVAALSITATALFVGWATGHAPAWAAWGYSAQGPFTIVTTAAIFIVLVRFATRSPRWLPAAAGLTYGIYLVHPALLPLVYPVVPLLMGPVPMAAAYCIQMAVVLLGSIAIVVAISRVPGLRRLV
jgi:surface polysaccharide O-acyltransferase-like enzyme